VPKWPDNLSDYIEMGYAKRDYSSEGMDEPSRNLKVVMEGYMMDMIDATLSELP
jgi:hypothetical protein